MALVVRWRYLLLLCSRRKRNAMIQTDHLGEFKAPVLLCGGVYGNLQALDALLAEAARRSIPESRIIHTGDVIAYCGDPEACAGRLRGAGILAIKGNVEEQIGRNALDCACGFDEGSMCQTMAVEWYAFANSEVSGDTRQWCARLPDHLTFAMSGRTFKVVHGSVDQVNRFMFASLEDDVFQSELAIAGTDAVIAGHTGLPFTRHFGRQIWHNTGALGLPANDGTPRVWFSVLTPMIHGVRFEHVALDYDHRGAAQAMRRNNLSPAYADTLESGVWPSLDILPSAEKQRVGQKIETRSTVWINAPRTAA